jgi:DNA-binding transcriptional LysR family regulator
MVLRNLDLDTLRTLVTTHDVGGFAQAADRLGRTPSAISLQMKRLQEELGTALFRKHGRALKLTEAGQTALGYARRMLALNDDLLQTMQGVTLAGTVRIGAPQDFAAVLPDALRQFTALYPRTQVELRVEGNGALVEALDKGQLDLTLTIGFGDRKGALLLGELPVLWIASRAFRMQDNSLPLAVLGPQCAFRKAAVNQLEAAGIPYRIAATSPSLDGLWAALQGGLGVTARTAMQLPAPLMANKSLHRLPVLPSFPVALHRGQNVTATSAIDALQSLLALATQGVLAQLAYSERLRMVRKSISVIHFIGKNNQIVHRRSD